MSVSDPLIRELKVCTSKFLDILNKNGTIVDSNKHLLPFCKCLERIFYSGVLSTPNSFGFIRQNDPWNWIEKISGAKYEISNYNFISSVENVAERKNVFTNKGRLRLFIRFCLVRKCLYVPIEYLIQSGKFSSYYNVISIIGDDILNEIFLSVLYQCSKFNFNLDLKNASFLDLSWLIPDVCRIDLVPTQNLGLTISFSGEKAVIINIKSNSVTAESRKISIGDVLDSMNGICICSATRGRLSSILKCHKNLPVTLTIIKAVYANTKDYYPPILNLFKEIDLDPDLTKAKNIDIMQEEIKTPNSAFNSPNKINSMKVRNGFKSVYVASVDVGRCGDVKLIDKAFNIYLANNTSYHACRLTKFKTDVVFEVGELGVKCYDANTTEMILVHSFMEISACGSTVPLPHYFAYIAGEEYCDVATNFKCYLFMARNEEDAYTILQGIGQGFERTHFAV